MTPANTLARTSSRNCSIGATSFRRLAHGGFLSVPYALVKEPLSERRGAFLLVFRRSAEDRSEGPGLAFNEGFRTFYRPPDRSRGNTCNKADSVKSALHRPIELFVRRFTRRNLHPTARCRHRSVQALEGRTIPELLVVLEQSRIFRDYIGIGTPIQTSTQERRL